MKIRIYAHIHNDEEDGSPSVTLYRSLDKANRMFDLCASYKDQINEVVILMVDPDTFEKVPEPGDAL